MRTLDVMTRHVITVGPDTSIAEAARLMLDNRISGLPVVESRGRLIGIVTEGDFLRRTETGTTRRRSRWLEFLIGPGRLADEFVRTHGRKVEDVMTPDPRTVTEDTPLEDAPVESPVRAASSSGEANAIPDIGEQMSDETVTATIVISRGHACAPHARAEYP